MANFYRFAEKALKEARISGSRKRAHAQEMEVIRQRWLKSREKEKAKADILMKQMGERGATERAGMEQAGETGRARQADVGTMARQRLGGEQAIGLQEVKGRQALEQAKLKPTKFTPITYEEETEMGARKTPGIVSPAGEARWFTPPKKKKKKPSAGGTTETGGWAPFDY